MSEDEEKDELEQLLEQTERPVEGPNVADPRSVVETNIPKDLVERYEIHSYKGAAAILRQVHGELFDDIVECLRSFSITTTMIRTAGGNESEVPKVISKLLRPKSWYETMIKGDLVVTKAWREQVRLTKGGNPKMETRTDTLTRSRYLDGHKIDYVKGRVAFDLEWNSKDQTFDRDLYAFAAFAQCGVIDVAVLVTRSESLNDVFRALGPSLKKDGTVEIKKNGKERQTMEKYGASTTWMGKLTYRLNAGRNGGCPVLVIGITPKCISDWKPHA